MAHNIIEDLKLHALPEGSTPGTFRDYLRFVRDNLCDARHRPKWWLQRKHQYRNDGDEKSGKPVASKAGAFGRLVSDVLNLRAWIADANDKNAVPVFDGVCALPAKALGEAIKGDRTMPELRPDQRAIGNFLCGDPALPSEDWMRHGRRILGMALVAAPDILRSKPSKTGNSATRIPERPTLPKTFERDEWPELTQILQFFFPDKPGVGTALMDKLGYFHDSLRNTESESTTAESIATIWRTTRVSRDLKENVQCIIRTSAGNRFQQTDVAGKEPVLLPSGEATLEALVAGVRVIFIHPTPSHMKVIENQAMTEKRNRSNAIQIDAERSIRDFLFALGRACDKREIETDEVLSRVHWLMLSPDGQPGQIATPQPDEHAVRPIVVDVSGIPPLEWTAFITPLVRHVAHGQLEFDGSKCVGVTPRTLLSRRISPAGLIVPHAHEHELSLFASWFKKLIAGHIRLESPLCVAAKG
jgi:hypothetical protein